MVKRTTTICVLCKKRIIGFGHNPYPITEKGWCCNECNFDKVIPMKLYIAREKQKNELLKK